MNEKKTSREGQYKQKDRKSPGQKKEAKRSKKNKEGMVASQDNGSKPYIL